MSFLAVTIEMMVARVLSHAKGMKKCQLKGFTGSKCIKINRADPTALTDEDQPATAKGTWHRSEKDVGVRIILDALRSEERHEEKGLRSRAESRQIHDDCFMLDNGKETLGQASSRSFRTRLLPSALTIILSRSRSS